MCVCCWFFSSSFSGLSVYFIFLSFLCVCVCLSIVHIPLFPSCFSLPKCYFAFFYLVTLCFFFTLSRSYSVACNIIPHLKHTFAHINTVMTIYLSFFHLFIAFWVWREKKVFSLSYALLLTLIFCESFFFFIIQTTSLFFAVEKTRCCWCFLSIVISLKACFCCKLCSKSFICGFFVFGFLVDLHIYSNHVNRTRHLYYYKFQINNNPWHVHWFLIRSIQFVWRCTFSSPKTTHKHTHTLKTTVAAEGSIKKINQSRTHLHTQTHRVTHTSRKTALFNHKPMRFNWWIYLIQHST